MPQSKADEKQIQPVADASDEVEAPKPEVKAKPARLAPRWQPTRPEEDDEEDLFNDLPV